MNDVSRRHWLGSAATLGVAAALAGTATAQGRPSADDLIRTVKAARMFDLSFMVVFFVLFIVQGIVCTL